MSRKNLLVLVALGTLLPLSAQAGQLFRSVEVHLEEHPEDGAGMAVIHAETFGTGLSSLAVYAPGGRMVASYSAENERNLGSQALRLESPKPYMVDLHTAFPEGGYKFIGLTYDGVELEGYWHLNHSCPPSPELRLGSDDPIIEGQPVAAGAGERIAWTPVDGAVAYDLRMVNGTTGEDLEVRVRAPKTSFTIPADWLEQGTTYRLMVGSVSESHNVSFTHGTFNTDDF